MRHLFDLIMNYQDKKHEKLQFIQRLIDTIFKTNMVIASSSNTVKKRVIASSSNTVKDKVADDNPHEGTQCILQIDYTFLFYYFR